MDIIRKAQIAAQLVAIMKADFHRPHNEEMFSILEMAKSQIADSTQISMQTEAQ
jgi:hypothetical protein